jgi:signal transduction histidine kinase/CheY-like chemotaxis protein
MSRSRPRHAPAPRWSLQARIGTGMAREMERSRVAPAPTNPDEQASRPRERTAASDEPDAEASAKVEALFDALPDIVARVDPQLRLTYVNAAVEPVTQRARSEFLGKTAEELGMPSDLAAAWNALLLETFATGRSAEKVFTLTLPVSRRVFHARTVAERIGSGPVTSALVIARDVSESEMYRSARADADRLRRLQAMTAAFSEAPTRGDIARVLVNQAHEAFEAYAAIVVLLDDAGEKLELAAAVGYPGVTVDRWNSVPLEADGPLAEVVRIREPLFFANRDALVERYPHLADKPFGLDDALAAIPLTFKERSFGAVALVFRKRHEFVDADRSFIVSLAAQATQAIDRARLFEAERAARQEAEAANRLKDEFLATMSHELRTPLHAVMGWAALLRKRPVDPTVAEHAIEAIHRNARAQAKLVEDILDVSRIIGGNLRLEISAVNVASAVATAVDVFRPAAYAKRIELDLALEESCVISSDAARLQQIIWNLVSNAVKFTPEGGRIQVSVKRVRGPRIAIEVNDTGAGIPAAFLPHVFERFRQLDGSTTRRHGGLGLGLAITRHLVELHGGTILAKSDGVGKGASFTIEFPTSFAREPQPIPASETPPSSPRSPKVPLTLQGLRALVIDDDTDGREMLCAVLTQCGADVFSAGSAESGLAQAESLLPDVLICDVGMPEMDGYALIRRLRALPESAGARTPAIAVTGFAGEEDVRRALDAGFQVHIAKPVDIELFTSTVAKLAGRSFAV